MSTSPCLKRTKTPGTRMGFFYKTEGRRPIEGPTNFIPALIQFCSASPLTLPETNDDKLEGQGAEKRWHVQMKTSCVPSFPSPCGNEPPRWGVKRCQSSCSPHHPAPNHSPACVVITHPRGLLKPYRKHLAFFPLLFMPFSIRDNKDD